MGERGPAPTPTRILKMRDSWRAKAREDEPEPDPGRPRCPSWLSKEARRAWRELLPQIDRMGLLSKTDRNALTRYCQSWANWRRAEEWLMEHGDVYPEKDASGKVVGMKEFPQVGTAIRLSEHLLRFEKQFGLTPSARAGLALPRDNPHENRGKKSAEDRKRFFGSA